jgi:spoIIIJ-associated protein
MSDELTIETSGETVGEAKWAALRELERRFPGLNRQAVQFTVVSEGERGLMGIGREPARVIATLGEPPTEEQRAQARSARPPEHRDSRPAKTPRPVAASPAPTGPESTSALAAEVRELLGGILSGLGLDASLHVAEGDDQLLATVTGPDLGVLIGKHGHTIDAVQYLVNAITNRGPDGVAVVVDAQGYRSRREQTLRETAERAARDALRLNQPIALEPMSSVERKVIHLHLKDRDDVETASDGREPFRHIVVQPRAT